MDDGGPTVSIAILVFIILLIINFLLVGFEAALQGLSLQDIEKRLEEEKEKDRKTQRLHKILEKPVELIVAIRLLLSIGDCAWAIAFARQGYYLLLVAGVLILAAISFYIPSSLALRNPERWAYRLVNPVYILWRATSPFYLLVIYVGKILLWVLHIKENPQSDDLTEEEILDMVNEGHEQGVIEASEAEMITNIIEFGDKEAQDIMIHRGQIDALDGDMHFRDAIDYLLTANNSRFPVYQESLDHVIGILHLKDAMRIHDQNELLDLPIRKVKGLLREPFFIPETRKVGDLFRSMQSEKVWMAIALDEYGQTTGLLTMEDILEEIVGNIQDEYDKEETYIKEKGNDEYVIDGLTPLEELEERFDIHFNEEEFETLNGFLISKMDKIPDEGEQFDITVDGYNFKILSVANKMIQSVLVTKQKDKETENKGE